MNSDRAEPTTGTVAPPAERPPERADEVEVWWGSCSARALIPSALLCLGLTAAVVWLVWLRLPRGWAQPVALGAGAVLWAFESFRWGRRFFGYNYRLTTRRLIFVRGVLRMRVASVGLRDVGKVLMVAGAWERRLGLGRIRVWREGQEAVALELEGVAAPHHIASLIRDAVKQARAE